MTGRVEGKVALITGAARGVGRASAVRLAQEGADIIAVDLAEPVPTAAYGVSSVSDLETTAELVAQAGRTCVVRHADVRDFATLRAAVDDGVGRLGRLDIVAANAAIIALGSVVDMPETRWHDVLDVNLTGAWHTCKAAIPHIVDAGRGGSITITSSVAGLEAQPNSGAYASSKHGVVGLMRTLALELGPHSIRANTIHPTTIETPMAANPETFKLFRPDLENPTLEEFYEGAQQLHALPVPWVQPEDIANALLFLASDEARYITGATLPVDAGSIVK
ncbi:mycofactocin-coupled SDR family oxidoreductase [Rhodococcus sp. NPDC057529]|uniref:mycofactocin-coupled SDR family oxidoreductase n=1 Tax=Rhodococcus sp. NPDC057529 TaxID=3346158 RepID=UPI0036725573